MHARQVIDVGRPRAANIVVVPQSLAMSTMHAACVVLVALFCFIAEHIDETEDRPRSPSLPSARRHVNAR